jgi:arginine-tRNA-protein transferase
MNDQVKLNFFASAPEPCSYLDNRKSISAFANPHMDMDMNTYNELIQHGFRRSGGYIYRPHCPHCQECISVRIPVRKHSFSRNEQRVIKRNSDIRISIMPGRYRDEHFDLYRRYINSRHDDGSMANPNKSDYHRFLICDWTDTLFFESPIAGYPRFTLFSTRTTPIAVPGTLPSSARSTKPSCATSNTFTSVTGFATATR